MIRKKRETTQVDMFDLENSARQNLSGSGDHVLSAQEKPTDFNDSGNPILMGSTSYAPKEDSGELISFDQILKPKYPPPSSGLNVQDDESESPDLTPDTDEFSPEPVVEEDTNDIIINRDFADGFYPGMKKNSGEHAEKTAKAELIRRRRRKRHLKLLAIGFLLTAVITALNWNEWVTQSSLFTLKTIEVTGNEIADRSDILQWSGLEKGIRLGPIDSKGVAEKIQKQPLFRHVMISKHYPSALLIRVEERKPVAFVAMDELHAMDADGIILPKLKTVRSYNLPVITGLRAALKTGSELRAPGAASIRRFLLTAQNKNPAVYFDISEVEYRKDGLRVYLNQWPAPFLIDPESPERSLLYLEAASDYFKKSPPGKKIREVDLRYEYKMIVREK